MNNRANHRDVVQMVSEELNDNEKNVQKYIDCYVEKIMECLCKGMDVRIKYLGTIKVEKVAPKEAWDFKLEKNVIRPSRMLPKMNFSRNFVNKIKQEVRK